MDKTSIILDVIVWLEYMYKLLLTTWCETVYNRNQNYIQGDFFKLLISKLRKDACCCQKLNDKLLYTNLSKLNFLLNTGPIYIHVNIKMTYIFLWFMQWQPHVVMTNIYRERKCRSTFLFMLLLNIFENGLNCSGPVFKKWCLYFSIKVLLQDHNWNYHQNYSPLAWSTIFLSLSKDI